MPKNDFHEPEWLTKARAEGRVISETRVGGGGFVPATTDVVPKAASGSSTKPRENKPKPMAKSRRSFTVVITPLRLASEANRSGKFRAYLGRKSAVKAAVASAFEGVAVPVQLPVTVTLTRLGCRKLDPDNLANSFKHVQDGVAAWLGIDDGDSRIRWRYRSRPGYASGCRIHVKEAKR